MDRTSRVPTAFSIAFGSLLAYVGTFWLLFVHHRAGVAEPGEPTFAVHFLRDATLAVPLVVLATVAVVMFRRTPTNTRERIGLAIAVAGAAALALGVGSMAHHGLFGVHHDLHEHAHGHPEGWRHVGWDSLVAFTACLPASLGFLLRPSRAAALVMVRPGVATARRRLGVAGVFALLASLPTFAQPVVAAAAAAPAPVGNPCPAGAPTKHFDVVSLDVNITLNRFGDHDPGGHMFALASQVAAVRAEEASHHVSVGLHGDAIQPLVIRANLGDCVDITFTNQLRDGDVGLHIDGLAFKVDSSGDAIGANASSVTARGATRNYRYYVPVDPSLEGARYIHPGPNNRALVNHGLFGSLVVEQLGSQYLHPETAQPLASGWEAIIVPGDGRPSFREAAELFHEIGQEKEKVLDKNDKELPFVDPHTTSYRPGTRAINYRSEPFYNRLNAAPEQESQGYSSYAFGDPATPMPRGYLADPTKFRILHAGGEVFHVYHLHGGGIRWRANPHADSTFDYGATGLDKSPKTQLSPSSRLDSQSFGPGESYDLEIEGGAGGVQQSAGDFLWHCHIAEHYISGMWSFWRVYNTLQPDLAPLPDRVPPVAAVDSTGLLGRTVPGGVVLDTPAKLDQWIRPQLPPQGVSQSEQDAAAWDWKIDTTNAASPLYLGEPEDRGPWPDFLNENPDHPSALRVDTFVGNRPKLLFNPLNGRPAWPLLRTHVGKRPPFSPNGHSGAPYLGENAQAPPTSAVDPYANRPDGLCTTATTGGQVRPYNIVALELPIQVTKKGAIDPIGRIFTLAKEKEDIKAGRQSSEPLAIRANIGDCGATTLVSELKDGSVSDFDKVNIHIHHVQFDVQASDGVITGFAYEQSVRPYQAEDPKLVAAAAAGATSLSLASVTKFQVGEWIAVGLGTDGIEIRQITAIDPVAKTVSLAKGLTADHPAGQWAGVEFVQERWYPDVALDNIFFHDHVDGIHNWGHGLVAQFVIEPRGSTYHDPRTGRQVDSGTIVDIHSPTALAPGLVDGSFREFVVWPLDENPLTDSTMNLRAEPWSDRNDDPSLRFSSYRWGDPFTPLPRAYPGDPFVVRSVQIGPSVDTLHIDGHRIFYENRARDAAGNNIATPTDTVHFGISEHLTLILEGGAGGPGKKPGDYLYTNGLGRRFRQGAWGIIRVLPGQVPDLQPLPGTSPPTGGQPTPAVTGGRPPEPAGPGNPCPANAPPRSFAVSAVDLPNGGGVNGGGVRAAFVPSADAAVARSSRSFKVEPLVLHAAANDCVTVTLRNERSGARVSFDVNKVLRDAASSGIDIGFNPESTVAPGQTRTYRFWADTEKIGGAIVSDFGGDDAGTIGSYGAVVVSPTGSTFTNPVTGAAVSVGAQVDVHVPGQTGHRDATVMFADDDPQIGASFMPYPLQVKGPAVINYQSAPRPDTATGFSSTGNGDPPTPILRAYVGDPVRVHAMVQPGSEQLHSFTLGGLTWPIEPLIPNSQLLTTRGLGPMESLDAFITGGAGGRGGTVGDLAYGDLRRPFTEAGIWGLQRVLSDASCPIRPLDGRTCLGG